ncbi:MAG TPA: carboxylating nicotinate-nucleotide diphosphorylase [Gemmatimonadaceae bacterium]|nr:carboxylating nicotinate-nucleotide diphosphorylase [Gemmatimonadaceae bacterium]
MSDEDFPLSREETEALVRAALEEDRAFEDVTTLATVPEGERAAARMVARAGGVIAGLPLAVVAFHLLDPGVTVHVVAWDGSRVARGDAVLELEGPARAILSAERIALNFVQRLSGIATLTARFVDAVRGTRAQILDTRKTTPTLRALEKYAVRCGGGVNHRMDLASAVLIKDNHLAAAGGDIAEAVRRSRALAPGGICVEVECDDVAQVKAAAEAGADIILLDNMTPAEMRDCVEIVAGRALTEASGGITLAGARAVAEAGVDRISVGALTHSAGALDVALDFVEPTSVTGVV